MKVSRVQATQNRARVLDAAAKLFRERGFDGIGVAEIMRAVGLTHGGFYGQFTSKDELALEACAAAIDRSVEKWNRLRRDDVEAPLAAIVNSYLSAEHRDRPGGGCLLPTLAVDVSRRDGPARALFTRGLQRLVGVLADLVPGRSPQARREAALATMAGLVGSIVLARAVDDPAVSDEILAAAAHRFGTGHGGAEQMKPHQ